MGVFDDLIKIDENGNVSYVEWVEWKHIQIGQIRCPICFYLQFLLLQMICICIYN